MSGQTRINGNLIDTGTDPEDIVSISTGDARYPKLEGPNTLTGDLTVDGGTLYVDSDNNRVGVGTSIPTHDLTIDKDQSNSVFTIRSANDGNSVVLLGDQEDPSRGSLTYENNNDALVFKVNNQQEAARIDSNGIFLVNTSTPISSSDSISVDGQIGAGRQRMASSAKSVGVGGSVFFDISGINSTVFVKIRIDVTYVGNAFYQMHAQYDYVTCNFGTGGATSSLTGIYQNEAGFAQYNYSDLSISRPSNNTVRLTYSPSSGAGTHICRVSVEGVFSSLN